MSEDSALAATAAMLDAAIDAHQDGRQPGRRRKRDVPKSVSANVSGGMELATVLDHLMTFIGKFVVLDVHQGVTLALWVAHTHALAAFDCTPYLQVKSIFKRSGKTRLLEVLELLVAGAWLTGRTTAAALVRKVDRDSPTLLLDESDAAFNGDPEYSEALRGILNSGFRRSGRVTLCVGSGGANISFRDFSTFSAKAIAGIGNLPGTVADRAIPIELKRKTKDERVERFRERDARRDAQLIRDRLVQWAKGAVPGLRAARPDLPGSLNDRAQDVLEPLLAVSDAAGGPWPERSRRAALALMGTVSEEDIVIELLTDLREIFADADATFIATKVLMEKLVALEDRPWATWNRGKPMTGHRLARLLQPLDIIPAQNAERTARGYFADRFVDAWARYLGSKCPECPDPSKNGPEPAFSKCPDIQSADTSKNAKTSTNTGLKDTPDTLNPGEGGAEHGDDDDRF